MPFDEYGLLSIRAWLLAPVLFAAAVLGLTGLGGVLLAADWSVAVTTGVSGPAAAVTVVLAGGVEWRRRRHRWMFGLGYAGLIFATGLVLAGLPIPTFVAMLAGTPALIFLGVLVARERHRDIPIV